MSNMNVIIPHSRITTEHPHTRNTFYGYRVTYWRTKLASREVATALDADEADVEVYGSGRGYSTMITVNPDALNHLETCLQLVFIQGKRQRSAELRDLIDDRRGNVKTSPMAPTEREGWLT